MSEAHETDESEPRRSADERAPAGAAAAEPATSGSAKSASATSSDRAVAVTPREEAALRRVRVTAHLLDEAVRVPGTNRRVGLDPLLGVLPVGGDAVAAGLGMYPVAEAYRFDLPKRTLAKMVTLVAIDAVIGSVPVLGTLFDAVWKANEWNRRTLERHLDRR